MRISELLAALAAVRRYESRVGLAGVGWPVPAGRGGGVSFFVRGAVGYGPA